MPDMGVREVVLVDLTLTRRVRGSGCAWRLRFNFLVRVRATGFRLFALDLWGTSRSLL